MNMKEKLKKILRYRKLFFYNECTVDYIMSMEKDCVKGKLKYMEFICGVEKDVSLCDIGMVIRIEEETYDCDKCALVDTISRDIGCPLIIKENLKGVE